MKLAHSISFLVLLLVIGTVLTGQAQDRQLIVRGANEAELRRTALRLGMCPEQLQDLRGLLDRATELALSMEDNSHVSHSFARLAGAWVKLDRSRAESVIQKLLENLRMVAATTSDSRTYMRATEQAIQLNRQLEPFLPDRSSNYLESWPDPPVSDPREFDQWQKRLLRQQMYSTIHEDPLRALEQLEEAENQFQDPNFRSQLIQRFLNQGSNDEAGRLLDETIEGLLIDPEPHRNNVHIASQLVSQAARHFPERLPDALEAWYQQILMSPGEQGVREIQIDGQSFQMTSHQQLVLNTVQNLLHNRPTTALEILNWFPDLASRLDTFGGLEAYLNRNRNSVNQNEYRQRQAEILQVGRADGSRFRDYLNHYNDPLKHVQKLIQTSSVFYHDQRLDPARGRELVDSAVRVAWEIEDVHQLRSVTQQLAGVYRRFEGEFPAALVSLFYDTLDRLEAAEESSSSRPVGYHLISSFVGQWLLVDRPAALSFLATRDDDQIELLSLLTALAPGGC